MLLEAGMKKNKLVKISAIIAAALLISACSTNVRGPQEKIAVINWEQAVSAHPQYAKLEQGEKILQDLLNKRKGQEELAKAQLSSLNKLRSLRQLSQQSFMEADFNTRMVEQREIENAKLQKFVAQAEADADNQLAARKKDVEDAYKLKLFNLRALLEAVKMKPDERQAVEKQLQELQKERGAQIAELQAEKRRLVDAKVLPYKAEAEQRIRDMTQQQHAQAIQQLKSPEERDKEMLDAAPKAFNNALSIIDREIDKQQEKNDSLKKQINQDIESQAVKLAHERGYTIVFNKFRVNMKAEDITAAIIKAMKKA
ncbi:outer membrane protein [Phascolarctobacterium succinatutens YIT 12067]|uniref:Outer membrane protein n=2 Tax=Phascolarctobacterium succinatutens TaxID=626940 RepID=E8LCM5_9FIRM|nr:outer membrane protein [Phascolarctobacterium succinatutens YIT 12067]